MLQLQSNKIIRNDTSGMIFGEVAFASSFYRLFLDCFYILYSPGKNKQKILSAQIHYIPCSLPSILLFPCHTVWVILILPSWEGGISKGTQRWKRRGEFEKCFSLKQIKTVASNMLNAKDTQGISATEKARREQSATWSLTVYQVHRTPAHIYPLVTRIYFCQQRVINGSATQVAISRRTFVV